MTMASGMQLIEDLSRLILLPLRMDQTGSCALKMEEKVVVQLQCLPDYDRLLIGFRLTKVPVGASRDNIFRDALQFNALQQDAGGYLAFAEKTEDILLCETLILSKLDGQKLLDILRGMLPRALLWIENLEQGTTHILIQKEKQGAGGSFEFLLSQKAPATTFKQG